MRSEEEEEGEEEEEVEEEEGGRRKKEERIYSRLTQWTRRTLSAAGRWRTARKEADGRKAAVGGRKTAKEGSGGKGEEEF